MSRVSSAICNGYSLIGLLLPALVSVSHVPDDEFDAEPDDYHNFKLEQEVLDQVLVLVVLDGGHDAQRQAEENHQESGNGKVKDRLLQTISVTRVMEQKNAQIHKKTFAQNGAQPRKYKLIGGF